MANKRIKDLTNYTSPATTDVLAIEDLTANETKKVTIQNLVSVADIDGAKITDGTLNLGLKGSVFDGWIAVSDSWTYASATTITVPSDATTKYSVGDKIMFVQSATIKYFTITAITSTLLTVNGGPAFTVANSAITSIYYSKVATPLGFDKGYPVTANVGTSQTTASTSYTDLATAGPAVTTIIGPSGCALIEIGGFTKNSGTAFSFICFAVSGATTLAAADIRAFGNVSTGEAIGSKLVLLTGLNAGSNTFTAKYRVSAGTGTFQQRTISVIPL